MSKDTREKIKNAGKALFSASGYAAVTTKQIAKKAESNIVQAKFEILENQTEVKIMGQGIFEDYSKALDNSLKITKGFMIGCVALFLTSLFF